MPSIDYPSEIEVVKDIEITHSNDTNSKQYSLETQQDMLSGDYFVKESEGWKEVHVWKKVELQGTENIFLREVYNDIAQFELNDISDADASRNDTEVTAISNYFKGVVWSSSWLKDDSIVNTKTIYRPRIMTSKYTTVETFKQFLAEKHTEGNSVVVYYKSTAETKLTCTEEQSAVLEQLNNLDMYKYTNNIITADSLALLQLTYTVDTKKYIDSKVGNGV